VLKPEEKQRLVTLSAQIDGGDGLGYGQLANMVIPYLNAPDSTPPILRGSDNQHPYFGIFPRTTDLPTV
jgi:hypothetical protein